MWWMIVKLHRILRGALHNVDRFHCDQGVIDELDQDVLYNQNHTSFSGAHQMLGGESVYLHEPMFDSTFARVSEVWLSDTP